MIEAVCSGVMKPGMVFTIEPCISEGDRRIKTLQDGWTTVTLVLIIMSHIYLNLKCFFHYRTTAELPK